MHISKIFIHKNLVVIEDSMHFATNVCSYNYSHYSFLKIAKANLEGGLGGPPTQSFVVAFLKSLIT